MNSVRLKYRQFLSTDCGAQTYSEFKNILYAEDDSLVSVLNNNYLPLLKPYMFDELRICDIGGGDGNRITRILRYLNHKFHTKFHLDFIEQSNIYCNQFRQNVHVLGEYCSVTIMNALFEKVELSNKYDLLILIHSIFAFENGSAVDKLMSLLKENGRIIIVSNAMDSFLGRLKKIVDGRYSDERYEIDELRRTFEKKDIQYYEDHFFTEWTIEREKFKRDLNIIFNWITLGEYDDFSKSEKSKMDTYILGEGQFFENRYYLKEKEEILIVPKI